MSVFEYDNWDVEITNHIAERYDLFNEETIEAIKTSKINEFRNTIILKMEEDKKLEHHNLMGFNGDAEFQDLHRAALAMLLNMYGINLRAGLAPDLAFNLAYITAWDNLETADYYCDKWIKREEA